MAEEEATYHMWLGSKDRGREGSRVPIFPSGAGSQWFHFHALGPIS
jgi:hypothetical protein